MIPALKQIFSRNPQLLGGTRQCSSTFDSKNWKTIVLKNGLVASWHPEKPFPYEYTTPVDLAEVNRQKEINYQLRQLDKGLRYSKDRVFGPAGPSNQTLQNTLNVGKTEFKTRTREERLYQTSAPIPSRRK